MLQVTFDSYLYKTVQGNNPLGDLALLGETLSSLAKNNLSKPAPTRELVRAASALSRKYFYARDSGDMFFQHRL